MYLNLSRNYTNNLIIIKKHLFNLNFKNISSLCLNNSKYQWNLGSGVSEIFENCNITSNNTNFNININLFKYFQSRGPKIVKPKDIIRCWKIRPGDQVKVISGKDKGKVGEVLMCDKLRNQVKVKGCNMRKLFVDSELVQIEKKIHYSNVQLIDKLLNVGTRVSIKYSQDNKPLRVSKKSGYVIPWPVKKKNDRKEPIEGEKDTSPEEALRTTYDYEKDLISMNLLRQTMSKYNREIT